MPPVADFQALVLDMDGLVLNTEPGYCLAWQTAARQLGYQLKDAHCQSMNGQSGECIERSMLEYFGADFPFEYFMQQASSAWQSHVERHGIETMPGFFDLMTKLENLQIPHCLATNSRRKNAYQCLQLAKVVDYFPLIATRDEVNHSKPAPDVFLLAARLLDIKAEQCLAIEDSAIGLQAAHRAGMIPVLIADKQTIINHNKGNVILRLTSLSELATRIVIASNFQERAFLLAVTKCAR